MGIEQRPYIGTWKLNNRKVIKHTPDALVFVNGDLSLPGCPTCSGKIDIQKYITQVSVDPSTEGPATASISLHVPRHAGDGLVRDGNFILQPGLEIHIYMRGYFPVQGLTSGITPEQSGGVDVRNSVMYPYYMVHHGVVTEVNHSYSGGEHTATISCADMLHFWQYQRMSTSGSLFGARPMNSKVQMSLVGHTMTGMSPYAIIYQLFRDVQGSAGGVEFALGNQTNAAANSTVLGESLFTLSILYWQKRFSQTMMSLRMYGADGTLYNAFQAAFLASLKSEDPVNLANKYAGKNSQSMELDPMIRASKISGFDPYSVGLGAEGSSNDGKLGVNVSQLQAFVSDISQWGNVNFWESQYATKLEIATSVKEACSFEFYQDVDGDLVFKPPFYNLDTSASRVYRIEDIDIISFDAASKEPDATVVKVTGGHFRGTTGFGLENNEWGTRAEFIDYRLVAKFGWRQQTFETTYHTDSQAMFFACVARFDIFNIGMNSASCVIPIRPELRPGYPVYIVSLDCFYYIHSFSHSFSFGGQCTTTLNLVGRRCKFYAPGEPPLDGSKTQISNIRLDKMHLPALPIEITEVDGVPGIPRLQGFPNVVMALDPTLINPLSFATGTDIDDLQSTEAIQNLISQARNGRLSVLQQGEETDGSVTDEATKAFEGPFQIQTGLDTPPIILPSVSELLSQAQAIKSIYDNKDANETDRARVESEAAPLLALVDAARDVHAKAHPEYDSSAHYLELLGDVKAAYNPGASLPGYYRYYSSSHPEAEMQGPATWEVGSTGILSTGSQTKLDDSVSQTAIQFKTTAAGGTTLVSNSPVSAGIPLCKTGTKDQTVSTPTHQITTFQIARFKLISEGTKSVDIGRVPTGFPTTALTAAYRSFFSTRLPSVQVGENSVIGDAFLVTFNLIADLIQSKLNVAPAFPNPTRTLSQVSGIDTPSKLENLAQELAVVCATLVSTTLTTMLSIVPPVSSAIGSRFGPRVAPETVGGHGSSVHKGVDFRAAEGTVVVASSSGTVEVAFITTEPTKSWGNYILIRHANGVKTRYAHLSRIDVAVGDAVVVNQQIGLTGSTGNVSGPHLHFEVLVQGVAIDPETYLASGGANNSNDLEVLWASVWPEGAQVQAGVGRKPQTKAQENVKFYDAPVFPVSDARGYEVIGTYRYGRGLTLESLDELSGFTASSTEDYDSVERFISTITKDGSEDALSIAIGSLSPVLRAVLASGTMSDAVSNALKLDNPGGTQSELGGINTPANKREFTQKSTLTNAAYSLADISATADRNTICSCRGAEADMLLQAFDTSSFVDVGDTEAVQDWLSEQMLSSSVEWAAGQAAYRGTVLDTNSGSLVSNVNGILSASTAAERATVSLTSLTEAQEQLDTDIENFRNGVS